MPDAWSKKDERQYEHIKKSEKKRGKSTSRAKEIAARTVNKQRTEEGRTKEQKNNEKLNNMTKKELYEKAKKMEISGRSKMNKDELIKAIQRNS